MIKNPKGTLILNERIYSDYEEFNRYFIADKKQPTLIDEFKSVNLKIGNTTFRFNCGNRAFIEHLNHKYRHFITSDNTAALEFAVEVKEKVGLQPITDSLKINTFLSQNQFYYLTSEALAYWTKDQKTILVQAGFKHFQMLLTAIIYKALLDSNGLVIHSSSIANNNSAYIFFGLSGSGKSTIADLSLKTHTVLSDDISTVQIKDGQTYVYANPLWGSFFRERHPDYQPNANEVKPLRYLIRPIKAPYNKLTPMSKTEALANLVAASGWKCDAYYMNRLFSTCKQLVEGTNTAYLYFKKDESFLKELHESK